VPLRQNSSISILLMAFGVITMGSAPALEIIVAITKLFNYEID